MRKASITFSALLATSLAAQSTTVVPSLYTTVEASSSTAQPFGLTTPARMQYLYSNSVVAVPFAMVTSIALRGNGGTAIAGKTGVDTEIFMSATPADPYRPSTTFATNHGANLTTVFTRKLVNLPALLATPIPANFLTTFPLDANFPYTRSAGNLIIDYSIHANVTGSYSHDTSFTQAAVTTAIGVGCGGAAQAVVGGSATTATSTLAFNLTGGPIGGQAVHLLGVTQLTTPIPLPFGGCLLYQDFPVMIPRTISATGTATSVYPLQFEYYGATVLGQYVAVDSGLTQLVASQSHSVKIGGYDPQSRIYNLTSNTTPTGTVQVGVGIVTQLTF